MKAIWAKSRDFIMNGPHIIRGQDFIMNSPDIL